MFVTTARFATPHGSKYLQQLCKHFAHKVEVSFDDSAGRAKLPTGQVDLAADPEGLSVTLRAEGIREMIEARYVVDKHLATFAHREGFTGFQWQMG